MEKKPISFLRTFGIMMIKGSCIDYIFAVKYPKLVSLNDQYGHVLWNEHNLSELSLDKIDELISELNPFYEF